MTVDKAAIEVRPVLFGEESRQMLTMFDGRYILWRDTRYGPRGFRWARRNWHDNGLGTKTHGAQFSLEDAALAVVHNEALRLEIASHTVVE